MSGTEIVGEMSDDGVYRMVDALFGEWEKCRDLLDAEKARFGKLAERYEVTIDSYAVLRHIVTDAIDGGYKPDPKLWEGFLKLDEKACMKRIG